MQQLLVEDHAGEGKCLARVDGKVIFIEDVVPGDLVDVRIVKSKKDWAEAKPVAFHQYSAERVAPFCSHFGICGGCKWQMLPYERQLFYKEKQVADTLERIGKIPLPPVSPILGAAHNRYYRNKIEYTFSNRRFVPTAYLHDPAYSSDASVAGFHARGLFDKVVDIETCHLQAEPGNKIRLAVKQFALDHDLSFYDIREHKGFLRTMQIRLCRTGELMVNLVLGEDDEKNSNSLLNHLMELFPEITSLFYTINSKHNDSIYDLEPVLYKGKGYVIEQLENFRYKIGPKSFFQTNTEQAENLYRLTREMAGLKGHETVYDLYCGTGSIGIFLSAAAARVVGIEVIPEAIDDARENARLNGIEHCRFFAGDVTKLCTDEFINREGRPDVVITDPPRAGMHEDLCHKILEMEAEVLVYVSCNPATQARDLNILGAKYDVGRIQPVDMFPHTHHIENIVQLKLKK